MENTKLNYKVDIKPKKDDSIKAKTKLSMQSVVHMALASTQPTNNPAGATQAPQQQGPNGWGRAM